MRETFSRDLTPPKTRPLTPKCCIITRTGRPGTGTLAADRAAATRRRQFAGIVAASERKKVKSFADLDRLLGHVAGNGDGDVGRMNMQYGIIYANFWHINRGEAAFAGRWLTESRGCSWPSRMSLT